METAVIVLAVGLIVCVVAIGVLIATVRGQQHKLSELAELTASAAAAAGAAQAAERAAAERAEAAIVEARRLADERERAEALAASAANEAPMHRADPVAVITKLDPEHPDELDDVDLSATRIASVTLAGPLIKVAAFSYGVKHALDGEQRMRIRYAMRRELKRQKKVRRRKRAGVRSWRGSLDAERVARRRQRSEGMT